MPPRPMVLWGDDRTDEDQLGASYDELEWAMEQVAEGRGRAEFEAARHGREVMRDFTTAPQRKPSQDEPHTRV